MAISIDFTLWGAGDGSVTDVPTLYFILEAILVMFVPEYLVAQDDGHIVLKK